MTRFQFQAPLAHKELVQLRIARMAAYCYAMDAVLYMTTGMLDRKDDDIQVETAMCKVFCSEFGWRAVNDAMQIMGGESYMTENEIERVFRDSRINLIVEGANEVMQSYIFGYGGKQLAEQMLGVKQALLKDPDESIGAYLGKALRNSLNMRIMRIAVPLGLEVYFGVRRALPRIEGISADLREPAERVARLVREHSYQFKIMSKKFDVKILDRQAVQARLADVAILLHAMLCTISRLDADLRARHGAGRAGDAEFERDRTAALHFLDLAEVEIHDHFRALYENADDSMLAAAAAAVRHTETLPNSDYIIPEKSPIAKGTGRTPDQDGIKQFPGDSTHAHPRAQSAATV
jgi:hypothetical protein